MLTQENGHKMPQADATEKTSGIGSPVEGITSIQVR